MLLTLRYSSLRYILAILFRPFGYLAPRDFKIIWLSNVVTMNVPEWPNRNCSPHSVHSTGILSIPKRYRLFSSISSNSMFVLIIWHQLNDLLLHLGTNILLEMTIKMVLGWVYVGRCNYTNTRGYIKSWEICTLPCNDHQLLIKGCYLGAVK